MIFLILHSPRNIPTDNKHPQTVLNVGIAPPGLHRIPTDNKHTQTVLNVGSASHRLLHRFITHKLHQTFHLVNCHNITPLLGCY